MNHQMPKILCVDDEPMNLSLLDAMLSPSGFDVVQAASGPEALEKIRTEMIDICLLDVMMPGIDGFEVCRRIKSDEDLCTIPVIMISALSDRSNRIRGIEAGAEDFISKPFDAAEVLARIKMLLHVKALTDKLKSATSVAEKASLAKSEFLSGMSHELRSPLNAILGFAQLMESDTPKPTPIQQESIDQILKAGWHLLTLINEILDLAKVESRQVPMSQEPVSLEDVMGECRGMIELQAQQHGITITFPRFDVPCFVMADRTRLKQILINLLSNAIKYNIEQGAVDISYSEITPGHIRISIRDTGAGLNPGQMSQLFQAFNRLGQEAGGEEGTGIGLVVAKRLVELMGGEIGVESIVGVGSVFWFELIPAAETQLAMVDSNESSLVRSQSFRGARLHTLLYIEDNPANLKLVEQIIARHPGIRLLTALNGNSGLEIARATRPDVILMDINLPDINGLEARKILSLDSATSHIPVIAISANAMAHDIKSGLEAGFFSYITKPIKFNEFMETVDSALEFAQKNGQQGFLRENHSNA